MVRVTEGIHYKLYRNKDGARMKLVLYPTFFQDFTTAEHGEFIDKIKVQCKRRDLDFEFTEDGPNRVIVISGMRSVLVGDDNLYREANASVESANTLADRLRNFQQFSEFAHGTNDPNIMDMLNRAAQDIFRENL